MSGSFQRFAAPLYTDCPPGACVCGRQALMQAVQAGEAGVDARALRLTREEEKRLLHRLEQLSSLADLRHMAEASGVVIAIETDNLQIAEPQRIVAALLGGIGRKH